MNKEYIERIKIQTPCDRFFSGELGTWFGSVFGTQKLQ